MMIPEKIKQHCVMHGEYPIPFTTLVVNGLPDFTATDLENWAKCVLRKLCGICGQPLDYWIYFIGGPLSMKNQTFFDPGMHQECAEYSWSVCPYICGRKDYRLEPRQHEGITVEVKHYVATSDRMLLARTRKFEVDLESHLIITAPLVIVDERKRMVDSGQ